MSSLFEILKVFFHWNPVLNAGSLRSLGTGNPESGRPTLTGIPHPDFAEVCAKAKRDLSPGEMLDAIGETCYRSWAMRADDARAANAWPVGLLHGGKVIAPIAKGEVITRDKVALPTDTLLMRMRMEQEKMFWGETEPAR